MLNTAQVLVRYSAFISFFFTMGCATADIDTGLQAEGWDEFLFDNKSANQFSLAEHGGIEVISESSVSLLRMPLKIDVETQPTLRWRWCVREAAPASDLSVRGADDRSLAIYVAFPFVAEEATAFELMERRVVEATVGQDAPGRVLMYVWGGDVNRGSIVRSPHLGDSGMMTILRSADAPTGQWFAEDIDIAADYKRAFGKPPPDPLYVAIGADTDDTASASRGIVMDLEFVASDRLF